MKKYLRFVFLLLKQNFKTIYFNFKYFPFRQAMVFPVRLSNKVYLRTVKGRIVLDCAVQTGMIRIGFKDVGIFDEKVSRSIWDVSGIVVFRGNAVIGHGSKISVGPEGKLVFGENFKITAESSIVAFTEIEFGKDCLLSWDILVMDTDFHVIKDSENRILNTPKKILVGDKVWIGCRSLILKGSTIPANSIIGANAVISKILDKENAVYAGNPVKLLKENVSWE